MGSAQAGGDGWLGLWRQTISRSAASARLPSRSWEPTVSSPPFRQGCPSTATAHSHCRSQSRRCNASHTGNPPGTHRETIRQNHHRSVLIEQLSARFTPLRIEGNWDPAGHRTLTHSSASPTPSKTHTGRSSDSNACDLHTRRLGGNLAHSRSSARVAGRHAHCPRRKAFGTALSRSPNALRCARRPAR